MQYSIPMLNNQEWLSRLFRRVKITPISGAFLLLILNLLTTIPLALVFGAWLPSSKSEGLTAEPSAWFNDYLVQPIIIAYFIWIQTAADKLLSKLFSEEIIQLDENAFEVLKKYQKRLQSLWLPRIAALFGLIFSFWFISITYQVQHGYPSWVFVHPAIVFVRVPILFVIVYALVVFIYDLSIHIAALNRLFKNRRIQIEPMHPDGAGGLASVGQFAANLGYFIGALGLAVSVNIVQHTTTNVPILSDYLLLIAIALYVCLSPVVFFLPLWTAHVSMVTYRKRLLLEISEEFDKVFAQLQSQRHKEVEENEPLLKKINQLTETQNLIKQFPAWPFNTNAIRKFFSLVFSPLLLGLVSSIIDFFFGLITK